MTLVDRSSRTPTARTLNESLVTGPAQVPPSNDGAPTTPIVINLAAARGRTLLRAREHRAVLAAVVLDEPSAIALLRADEMARTFDSELFVVRVVPVRSWIDALLSPLTSDRECALVDSVESALHSWCESMLAHPVPRDHVVVRDGAVVANILDVADELDAELIVLGCSDTEGHDGSRSRTADGLIRRAGRPVLVARRPTISSEVVAATDLSDPAYPALRHAASLGARFHAPVTFLHNVDQSYVVEPEAGGAVPSGLVHAFDHEVERRRAELAHIAEVLDRGASTVVLALEDTPHAILELSWLYNADLVVVGTHHRTLLDRIVPHTSTAVSVARRSKASVLVVPLDSDLPTSPLPTSTAA